MTAHVEVVVKLSKRHVDQYIEVDLEMEDVDLTTSESKATYPKIKEYVLKNQV